MTTATNDAITITGLGPWYDAETLEEPHHLDITLSMRGQTFRACMTANPGNACSVAMYDSEGKDVDEENGVPVNGQMADALSRAIGLAFEVSMSPEPVPAGHREGAK